MKTITQIIAVLFFSLFIISCGDSHDKLMNDQVSWIENMTDILTKVADGKISSSEAVTKLEKLNEVADKIAERKVKLNAEMSAKKLQSQGEKYKEKLSSAFKEYMTAVSNLRSSGRMTQELANALQNMKPNGSQNKTTQAIEAAADEYLNKR